MFRIRIRIRPDPPVFGLSGSGSWLKMPISLTIWQVFCLVDFSFFKFILKNAHFLNILVNFGSCGKMLKIFLFLNFFLKILLWLSLLTPWIRIRIRDPDPDPHQNFRSDPDPLQNKADPKPWEKYIWSFREHRAGSRKQALERVEISLFGFRHQKKILVVSHQWQLYAFTELSAARKLHPNLFGDILYPIYSGC